MFIGETIDPQNFQLYGSVWIHRTLSMAGENDIYNYCRKSSLIFIFSFLADSAPNMGTEWSESDKEINEEVWPPREEVHLCPHAVSSEGVRTTTMVVIKCFIYNFLMNANLAHLNSCQLLSSS